MKRALLLFWLASSLTMACTGEDTDTDVGTDTDTTDVGTEPDTEVDTGSDTEPDTTATTAGVPGAYQQSRLGTASGTMTSESHRLIFSLGSQPPPATGTDHSLNAAPTESTP